MAEVRFNPLRLQLARRRRGLTKIQLASQIGVSVRTVGAYVNGEKEPSTGNLEKVAEMLEFPVSFFFGPDLPEPPLQGTSFRALSNLTARARDQALGSGAIALSLMHWIEERFDLPVPNVPQFTRVNPETAAMAVRAEWGLGELPASNMLHLLEAHGVRVFSLVEECRELDAYSFWFDRVPIVFLNTVKSAEHSRMDAAHELGHLVLHTKVGVRGRPAEREADQFASAFLMPRGSVIAGAPRGGRFEDILAAKQIWNVSAAALTYRMYKVGLLSHWQYRSLFVELSYQGYRRGEPFGGSAETSQVLAKVFEALRQDGVTKSELARDLSIAPAEIDKVVFGLVMTLVEGQGIDSEQGREHSHLRLL